MSLKNIKKLNINLMALTLAIFLAFIYFVGSSFAWFTDSDDFEELGDVAQIEMQLLNGSNEPIAQAPSFTYTGTTTNSLVVKIKNTNISTINAIVRVMIVAFWSNGASVYETEMGHSITYAYDTNNWTAAPNGIGYDYVYYNATIAPNTTVNFLTSITFPTLPSSYNNQTATFIINVEGLQANGAGVNLWADNSPVGWAPLAG